jgi:hypothetical protein
VAVAAVVLAAEEEMPETKGRGDGRPVIARGEAWDSPSGVGRGRKLRAGDDRRRHEREEHDERGDPGLHDEPSGRRGSRGWVTTVGAISIGVKSAVHYFTP